MNILLGSNHLVRTGGTETFVYALAESLQKMGHNVEYFSFERGEVSSKLEKIGIRFMSKNKYDLILANHKPVVDFLVGRGVIIQTCHGHLMGLEAPSQCANLYVSISEETRSYLLKHGKRSVLIYNGINCNRFSPIVPINEKLRVVLSLCQSNIANDFVRRCCNSIGVTFIKSDKNIENKWEIEETINKADLVVGIGRSLYDAMASGRAVISYDFRSYMREAIGDGYLNEGNIENSLLCNCSGRSSHRSFTETEFIEELKKYNTRDGAYLRRFAEKKLNMDINSQKYIDLYRIMA